MTIKYNEVYTDRQIYECCMRVMRMSGASVDTFFYYGDMYDWYVPKMVNMLCCPTKVLADGRCTTDMFASVVRYVYGDRNVSIVV